MDFKSFQKLSYSEKRSMLVTVFSSINNLPAFYEVLMDTITLNQSIEEGFLDKVFQLVLDVINAKDQKEKNKALEKLNKAVSYLQKLHKRENQEHSQDMLEAEKLLFNL